MGGRRGVGRRWLTVTVGGDQRIFSGEEIRLSDAEIGKLATVTTRRAMGRDTETGTLVLPAIDLDGESTVPVETFAIRTVTKGGIAGSSDRHGQIQQYKCVRLAGRAAIVRK